MKKLNNILNKKVPLGIFLASLFVMAALVYSFGYHMAMEKFNSIVGYTHEKQKNYSKLSEVDYNVREGYIGEFNEDKLSDAMCSGYMRGLGGNSKFLSSADYKSYVNEQENLSGEINSQFLQNDIGLIKCACLGKNFSVNFIDSLNKLISEGAVGVVIDLRGVSSGTENEVFKTLEYISPKGDILKKVDASGKEVVVCSSSGAGSTVKFAVLTDDKTSGIAEAFVSALKDSCKAKHVGVETAGNAVHMKVVNLSDDSVIVFPDAFYVSSSGKKFFKKGITPEISVTNKSADEDAQLGKAVASLSESK